MRTLDLGKQSRASGSAQYFALFSASKGETGVEGAKFISGDENLRALVESVQHLKMNLNFPDDTPTKILRRGVVSCSAGGVCTFVLMLPDDVRSID